MTRLGASALHTLEKGCRREYALRYKVSHYWPALDDPAGRAAALVQPPADPRVGQAFHALVHQHALGLDVTPVLKALAIELPKVGEAWAHFVASPHATPHPDATVWTEQALHFNIDGIPATVVYDRLVRQGDAWTILDWKTGHPQAKKLQDSWQAKLYRWALVEAGAAALARGEAIAPAQVTLVFWDVNRGEAIPLEYDADEHARTGARLHELARLAAADFDPTVRDDVNFPAMATRCARCSFRDYCGLVRQRLVRPAAPERPVTPHFILAEPSA